jgi:hypothetical protein
VAITRPSPRDDPVTQAIFPVSGPCDTDMVSSSSSE